MKLFTLAAYFIFWSSSPYAQGFPTQNLATANPTCSSTASQAVAARFRNGVTITVPSGGVTVSIGGSGVTFATGFQIAAGAALTLEPYAGPVYCITSSSSQAVSVLETF